MGNTVITYILIYTFILFITRWSSCNGNSPNNSTVKCKPSERAALLNFKHNLTYVGKDISSSWKGWECCQWSRVVCDNTTGHILELNFTPYDDDDENMLKVDMLESLVYLLELKQLASLELSFNNFGYSSIPRFMGSMKQLRYLGISSASLGGLVPYELGPIPTGNQLQTLSDQASIYSGNPYLCGDFLPKKCESKVVEQAKGTSNEDKSDNKEKLEKMGLVLVVMSGFATGFWGVVGGLVLNRRWRHAVFRRVEDGYNWLYVIVAVRVAKARRINRR